jgi:hypothetical protein
MILPRPLGNGAAAVWSKRGAARRSNPPINAWPSNAWPGMAPPEEESQAWNAHGDWDGPIVSPAESIGRSPAPRAGLDLERWLG